ncbi:(2Fe-2S)-binding protein [Brevibacillus laterosporus]|uniref:(2Fe-2S)-binding protein n=1 Tax=Brevibacillus laterosporus TaxID=1465 RepID=A0A518VD49_BRELA|nr:(2Fe-2S)-binding protein [Brevibacillus laterosporus]
MKKIYVDLLDEMFNIHLLEPKGAYCSIPATDLLNESQMRKFLDQYAPIIKALDDTATAAYIASWFLTMATGLQYMVSVQNKALDLSLTNLIIHMSPKKEGSYTRISFQLRSWTETEAPWDGVERQEWRREVLSYLYGKTLRPLLECMSAVTGFNVGQMWGQLPTKFHYFIEDLVEKTTESEGKQRVIDDFDFLKQELSSSVFGRNKNPFDVKVRLIEHLEDPTKQLRMKNVCCRYFMTEGADYCYTCPRMREEDREARRIRHRSEIKKANA